MALIENDNANGQVVHFVRIAGGKFVTNAAEGVGESRINKKGVTVWEKKFSAIEGYLHKVEVNEKGYEGSEQFEMIFLDAGEKLIIQNSTKNGVFRSLAKRLPNIDPTKKVKLSVFESEFPKGSGIMFTNISVRQEGETITDFFEGDVNMPQPTKVRIGGKEQTDYFDVKEYLKIKTIDLYNEKVGNFMPSFSATQVENALHTHYDNLAKKMTQESDFKPLTESENKALQDDDLPF